MFPQQRILHLVESRLLWGLSGVHGPRYLESKGENN